MRGAKGETAVPPCMNNNNHPWHHHPPMNTPPPTLKWWQCPYAMHHPWTSPYHNPHIPWMAPRMKWQCPCMCNNHLPWPSPTHEWWPLTYKQWSHPHTKNPTTNDSSHQQCPSARLPPTHRQWQAPAMNEEPLLPQMMTHPPHRTATTPHPWMMSTHE